MKHPPPPPEPRRQQPQQDHRYDIPPNPSASIQETDFEPPPRNQSNYGSIQTSPPTPPSSNHPGPDPVPSPTKARILAPDLLRGLLMALMALDHTVMGLNAWPHGTSLPQGENDSSPVTSWNRKAAYVIRTLTHLCAPGFTFLLGMGVVYFARSRTALPFGQAWGTTKLATHFLVRGIVLTIVSEVMGLIFGAGKVWVFNIILISLAVDYVLAGMMWILLSRSEVLLARVFLKFLPEKRGDDPSEPLLRPRSDEEVEAEVAPDRRIIRAGRWSWHLHNLLLAVLAVVTIGWNIWLSPTGGHCDQQPEQKLPSDSIWARIWFYQVSGDRIVSGFPPLAWISFAVLGLLYGRVILAKTWTARAISLGNGLAGLMFLLVFVMTRLFRFGNLSEGCLQMMVGQGQEGEKNQYLASPAAFFYIIKYPPDVAFWSFTMAGNHFLLAMFSAIPSAVASKVFHVLLVFGTSALFFYVVHVFVAIILGWIALSLVGHEVGRPYFFTGKPVGVDQLWAFFITWVLVLAVMYPLCRWYGGFKRSKGPDSLWRFF